MCTMIKARITMREKKRERNHLFMTLPPID